MSDERKAVLLFEQAMDVAGTLTEIDCEIAYLVGMYIKDRQHEDVAVGTASIPFSATFKLHERGSCCAPMPRGIKNLKSFYEHPPKDWHCEVTVFLHVHNGAREHTFHSCAEPTVEECESGKRFTFSVPDVTPKVGSQPGSYSALPWTIVVDCNAQNKINTVKFVHEPRDHPDLVLGMHKDAQHARVQLALSLLKQQSAAKRRCCCAED